MIDRDVSPYPCTPDYLERDRICPECEGEERVIEICRECNGAGIQIVDITAFPFAAEICECEGREVSYECERCDGYGMVYPNYDEDEFDR